MRCNYLVVLGVEGVGVGVGHHQGQEVEGEGVGRHQVVGVGVEHLPHVDHHHRHLPVWSSTVGVREIVCATRNEEERRVMDTKKIGQKVRDLQTHTNKKARDTKKEH